MCQPAGFEEELGGYVVCKLNKSLYGLKQTPRGWFDKFSKAIKRLDYKQGQANHKMFVRHSREEKITILIVYLDDIIITGDDNEENQTNDGQGIRSQRPWSIKIFLRNGDCKE